MNRSFSAASIGLRVRSGQRFAINGGFICEVHERQRSKQNNYNNPTYIGTTSNALIKSHTNPPLQPFTKASMGCS